MIEEKTETKIIDRDRLSYMVAWRDRYIQRLEERLAGREEENAMLQALLFYALVTVGRRTEGGVEIPIPKQEVTRAIGCWRCDTTDGGEHYLVSFTPAERTAPTGDTRGDKAKGE